MLRYYRFILLRSRNLVPSEHHIVEGLNVQSFRLTSSNTSVRNDPKIEQYFPIQKHSEQSTLNEESESEKLVNSLTNRRDFYGVKNIHAYIALLKVWLDNEHEYDVDAILEEAEIDLKFESNVEFYNKLLWRLAETKDVEQMEYVFFN
uniref:Pentatricopeptide repeat-containing protein n=1 Tax=Panagrolaimus davidi TaxID=227884 RepID=A0A914PL96_9BILA